MIDGANVACDKTKVRDVLQVMLDNKVFHLGMTGQYDKQRYLASVRHWIITGLPHLNAHVGDHEHAPQQQSKIPHMVQRPMDDEAPGAIELLKARLNWGCQDNVSAQKTGRSLLFYATLANEPEAVRALLQHQRPKQINAAMRNPDFSMGELPFTPLMASMTFGSFEMNSLY